MRTKVAFLIILLCCIKYSPLLSQYTPKYTVSPSEYNCFIIPSASHQVYDVSGGLPTLIPNQPAVVNQIAGSLHHACLLDNAGNCYCWGDNANGEIGNGATSTTNVPAMYKIATDSTGNPFTNIVQVMPGGSPSGYLTAALKSDGTVWIWGATGGGNRGNGTQGGTNTRPVQVKFPAGTMIKKIQTDIVGIALDASGNVWTWGANSGYLAPYLLAQGTNTPDPTTPHKIALPSPAKDITGGSLWNYALLSNGSLYGWGYYSAYLGLGTSFLSAPGALVSPQLLDAQLGFPHPVASVSAGSSATYAILTDSTLWAWGDNAVGAIGNGKELNFATYTVSPAPTGGTPAPYEWDWSFGELMQNKPVQIAIGLHSFTNIWTSGADVFYCYAEDVHGQLYSWGRNKGAVLGNGVVENDLGAFGSIYPNSWDVPWVTAINPFGLTKKIPTSSPYCVTNASSSPCNAGPIPAAAAPAVSAGANQNITGGSAPLNGSATPAANASINYYLWTQTSGPNTALIVLNTGAVAQATGLITGTYIFQLKATDNNWRSNASTVTIMVNTAPSQPPVVNAGTNQTITLPANSVSLAGTATASPGIPIASTIWTETGGPNTATIATPGALSTSITGMIAGTYIFRLTATTVGLAAVSGSDTITVNAASIVTAGYTAIPATIQAESYSTMSDIQTQATTDAGGGLNVGWIDLGSWMKYNVTAATAGTYTIGFRIASIAAGGILQLKNAAGTVLTTLTLPSTGAWQNWRTVNSTVSLPAGNQTLQIVSASTIGWNINWMSFANGTTTTSDSTGVLDAQAAAIAAPAGEFPATTPALILYPNPATDQVTLSINNTHTGQMTVQIINLSGQITRVYSSDKEGQTNTMNLNISGLTRGVYAIRVQIGDWFVTEKLLKL